MGAIPWILLTVAIAATFFATFKMMTRASKAYERKRLQRGAEMPARRCTTCGAFMDYAGLRELGGRAGGQGSSEIADNAGPPERGLTAEEYRCPVCRKVEFFLPPAEL